MLDLGARVSDEDLDLDDLDLDDLDLDDLEDDDLEDDEDLGESRRAVERFQLWESRGRSRYK